MVMSVNEVKRLFAVARPFKAGAVTMLPIAADPKHLGARIGFTPVLHS